MLARMGCHATVETVGTGVAQKRVGAGQGSDGYIEGILVMVIL